MLNPPKQSGATLTTLINKTLKGVGGAILLGRGKGERSRATNSEEIHFLLLPSTLSPDLIELLSKSF